MGKGDISSDFCRTSEGIEVGLLRGERGEASGGWKAWKLK